ncbi:MAG: hypothetical protein ACE14P_03915 [Methanotrichaceae archaeon]
MVELSIRTGKWLGAYALLLGTGYGAAALAEAIGNREISPGGLLSIGVLLVVSATYLMGVKGLIGGRIEGLSFLLGGLFLSIAVGGLYLLMTGADGLMYVLGEVDEFSIIADIKPATLLLLLALPLLPLMKRLTHGMVW